MFRKALALLERPPGAEHVALASALNDLAVCYKYLARFLEAGPLYQRALRILERRVGHDHPDVATIYHNLGGLEHAAGNGARGEPFARASVRIRIRALGPRHPDVAADLTALGALLDQQRKFEESQHLYERALAMLERAHGPKHHLVAVTLNNLGAVHQMRRRPAKAEALYRRALAIDREALGDTHPKVASELNNLAALIGGRRPEEAASLYRQALAIFRRALGPDHPNVGVCLENFAPILARLGRNAEAQASARRAARILARVPAVNDRAVAVTGTINPDRARFQLLVRRSRIHRLGVFADERIPPGKAVIEFTGERIDPREARRRWSPALSYLFALDERRIIDGAIGGSGAEYVNHSCDPNLRATLVRGRLWYASRRPIAKGEELSVDYKYSGEASVRCRCGAASCRGSIAKSAPTTRRARGVTCSSDRP